jgi:biotin synthase
MNATAPEVRSDWRRDEIEALFDLPLLALLDRARALHLRHQDAERVQLATLANIKSGGCPEDCGYCPQSAHHEGAVANEPMMAVCDVVAAAKRARDAGAARFCMGAAWRRVRDGEAFDRVVEMVQAVHQEGLEVCVTLGMLEPHQIARLREAGLYAYNHNVDTSPEYYGEIVHTRQYADRLETLAHARAAGVSLCSGGILGMGESEADRVGMLHTLATMNPHPESVPLNQLVRAPGTPLADAAPLDPFEFVRVVAVARIVMPDAVLRLAAGRSSLSREAAAMAFYAGANSIFYGEKLLTTPNPDMSEDRALLAELGLEPMQPAPRA